MKKLKFKRPNSQNKKIKPKIIFLGHDKEITLDKLKSF